MWGWGLGVERRIVYLTHVVGGMVSAVHGEPLLSDAHNPLPPDVFEVIAHQIIENTLVPCIPVTAR